MKSRIWIALTTVYIFWGLTYLGIHYAVQTIPPFLMAGTRFLLAGLTLFVWRRAAGDAMPTPRQWGSTAIVGVLLLMGGNGMLSFAEQKVPSGISALLIGTVPLWMVLIEAIRPGGVRPGWQTILGLVAGFGGIALLIGPAEFSTGGAQFDVLAVALLLFGALCWSIGSVYSRTADQPSSSLMSTAAEMLAGGVSLYLLATLTGEWRDLHLGAISLNSLLGLGYLVLFGSLLAFTAYAWLLRNVPVSLVATYAYVNPMIAILAGVWFAAETVNLRILAAALIIIGSVILINFSPKAKAIQVDEATTPASD